MIEVITLVISAFFLIVSSAIYLKSQLPKQTISNQKELIDAQEKRIKVLEDSDKDKAEVIAGLVSKVDVLATIPLDDIAQAIKGIVVTQKEIVKLIHTNTDLILKDSIKKGDINVNVK